MEKKDTENREIQKKPEEQAKPKKKNIISVVRPQNATSKEAREFTRTQGQRSKGDRPSRPARPDGNRASRPDGSRTVRQQERPVRQNTAEDVKAQSVKPETASAVNSNPAANNTNTAAKSASEQRPAGERTFRSNERTDRPFRNNERQDRSAGERTFRNNDRTDRPNRQGDRPMGERTNRSDRPAGDRTFRNNDRNARTNERTDRPMGDRQNRNSDRPFRNNDRTDRPAGDRQNRQNDRPMGDRQNRQGDRTSRPGMTRPFQGKDEENQSRRPQSDRRRSEHKSNAAETMDLGIKKPTRDTGKKEKDKNKDTLRENKFSEDRRSGNRPNQGHHQQSKLPKALQKPAVKPKQDSPKDEVKEITLPEKMTIRELAEKMKMQPSVIVKKLFMEGIMVTVNHEIEFEKAQEIAMEYNIIAEPEEKVDVIEELLKEDEENPDDLVPRPPVVCVMGHVDHGKTSLLDCIRNTHVTDREAGGITQHIGAYTVSVNKQRITFLDTPGHEAFTAMRMRGANATDIAILVVAADDGVMPQTVEAINHAKAAGVEIVVAINKIDKPGANVERVKQELSEYELIPEDWGGSTVFVPVSAKTQEGIEDLLEMILLTSEVLELKANPKRRARGLVIEAELDKGKGPVATILVQKGTLHVGDYIAAGACSGKVRAMMDDKGRRVKEAGPSTPVEILGLSDVPNAGEVLVQTETDKEAKNFAATFVSEGRKSLLEETKAKMSLDDLFNQIQEGNLKELGIVVKADVQGSVEAVKQSLVKLSNDEVVVRIVHGGVGAINESDVMLASASNAIIIGFNVRPDATTKSMAEQLGVDVRLYRVIYQAIEDVEAAMKGMLEPIYEEKVIGHAEIRQLFKASGVGTIAGSYVMDGVFQRGCKVRISREGEQIFEGALASLKRFKDDVKEVRSGYECGLVFEGFNDIQEFDQVEAYIMVEVPR
ncbi:MAG: translation initiation factor IF-2 [Fusicatenibacter sp.]|nr:translation initiation factor IF-2 [Fusicatenibacter sp.]